MGKKQGGKDQLTDDGIAPGLDEFEAQLAGGGQPDVNPDPPDPELLLEPEPPVEDDGDDVVTEPETADPTTETIDPELEAPPVSDDEPTPAEPSETAFKVPDDKFYGEFRGQDMTAKQLEEAGLLDKILTGAHQVATYQALHEESKSNLEKLEARLETLETPPAEEEPPLTAEQFQANVGQFAPLVEGLVADGLVESDYATVYPKKAALDEFRVKVFIDTVDEMNGKIKALEERVGPWQERDQEHQAVTNVSQIVSDLVKEDEALCGGLSDEATQKDFFAYLADKERSGARFTPYDATKQDIRGGWVGYLLDRDGAIPGAVKEKEEAPPAGQKGMTGTGGKQRGRGSQPPAPKNDEFAELEESYLKAKESRFAE